MKATAFAFLARHSSMGEVALRVRNGTKSVGNRPLISGVSLELLQGGSCAIVGRSGSGKSTLLAILGLLDRFDEGELHMAGNDTVGLSRSAIDNLRRTHVGFVFQRFSLIRHLNVFDNVAAPLHHPRLFRAADTRARVLDALDAVGLGDFARKRTTELSGGEQQRVAIARALVSRPTLLLADEPTGSLDTTTGEQVISTMLDASRLRGTSVIVVTHDLAIAGRFERTLTLRTGQLLPPSPPESAP